MLQGQLGLWRETGDLGKTRSNYLSHAPVEVEEMGPTASVEDRSETEALPPHSYRKAEEAEEEAGKI